MRPITVIGAGFSGLTLAYYLRSLGMPVQVIEKGKAPGGRISTKRTQFGIAETAANALLADAEVEALFADLKLEFAERLPERGKRYIYWKKPTRWPLSVATSLKLVRLALKISVRPHPGESVTTWGERVVDAEFVERLLGPALQGVYAGTPDRLSASLVMARLLGKKPRCGKLRGSIAPALGMGQLMQRLEQHGREAGVEFLYDQDFKLSEKPAGPVVICTSGWAAAEIVRPVRPELADSLARCESLPLVSVTAFYPLGQNLRGFGCLFPKNENFHALGVLFNDCVFAGRSEVRSETWIFGGADHPKAIELSDEALLMQLASNRSRLVGRVDTPLHSEITRWPRAVPYYTPEWEKELANLSVERPLFLHGNYLGSLGLSSILQRSRILATEIRDLYAD